MRKKRRLRRLVAFVAVIAVVLSMAAGCSKPAQDEIKITMFIWAGSNQGVVPQEVGAAYMKEHPNVKIEYYESNNALTYPKMVTAKETTPDQPLVHMGFFNATTAAKGDLDDMWQELDPEKIPNMKLIPDHYWREDNKGIGMYDTPIGILYNTNYVKEPPTSWADLLKPEYKGKLALWDYTWYMPVMLSYGAGADEHNIDPGFQQLSEHVDSIHSVYTANDQMKNLIVSGDVWFSPWYTGISSIWIDEGAPLAWAEPKEGTVAFPAYLEIVKGITPEQQKVCEDLVNMLLDPKWNGRYCDLTSNIPCAEGAVLEEENAKNPLMDPKLLENAKIFDWGYIAEQDAAWKERWDKEIKGKMG